MPQTTPKYALPYPLASDTADVPRDVLALANRLEAVLPGVGVPTGGGIDWYATAAPSGFLLCDGSAVSRTTFAALFAAIGTTWGAGDGSSTFNLPDCRGRVLVGVGSQADVATIALNDGAALANRRPRHFHPNALTLPNHAHSVTDPTHSHGHALSLPGHAHGVGAGTYFVNSSNLAAGNTGYAGGGPPGWAVTDSGATATGNPTSNPGISGSISGAGTGLSVGNPTSNPAIGGSIGPTVTSPQDGPSYVVANKAIKT